MGLKVAPSRIDRLPPRLAGGERKIQQFDRRRISLTHSIPYGADAQGTPRIDLLRALAAAVGVGIDDA